MENIITKDKEFKDLVHIIRGQQVMLDSDLARLYGYEVKNLNKQVNRHIEKFPEDFRFQLTIDEAKKLPKFQFGTLNTNQNRRGQNIKKSPYVFTEIGVYMLATVLSGKVATEQSMYIMRSFQKMKHHLAENKCLLGNTELSIINNRLDKHEADINKIMDKFIDETNIKEITFLEGQKFEANEAYISIYKQAKHTIYVIDNYVDFDTLSLLRYKQQNVDVIIFTANKGKHKLRKTEVDNFCNEYPKLTIRKAKAFHDRYIILDYSTSDEIMYHCSHSSKDTGNKVCTIHQMLDIAVMHPLIDGLLENKTFLF